MKELVVDSHCRGKTFPLESKASNLANCSAHWSDISFSWSDETNEEVLAHAQKLAKS